MGKTGHSRRTSPHSHSAGQNPAHFRRTPTKRSPTCPPLRGRPPSKRRGSSRGRAKVELALTVSFDFGRFRVLFDSLFRVLFDCPSQYLFALGLAVGIEPRVERTTSLRAAISSNPTLEPRTSNATRRYSCALDGPDARSGHGPCRGVSDALSLHADDLRLWSIRHNSSAAAFGAAGFSAGLTFNRIIALASLAVTGRIPVGFSSTA